MGAPLPISLERRARAIADTGLGAQPLLHGTALRNAIYAAALEQLHEVAGERRRVEAE